MLDHFHNKLLTFCTRITRIFDYYRRTYNVFDSCWLVSLISYLPNNSHAACRRLSNVHPTFYFELYYYSYIRKMRVVSCVVRNYLPIVSIMSIMMFGQCVYYYALLINGLNKRRQGMPPSEKRSNYLSFSSFI